MPLGTRLAPAVSPQLLAERLGAHRRRDGGVPRPGDAAVAGLRRGDRAASIGALLARARAGAGEPGGRSGGSEREPRRAGRDRERAARPDAAVGPRAPALSHGAPVRRRVPAAARARRARCTSAGRSARAPSSACSSGSRAPAATPADDGPSRSRARRRAARGRRRASCRAAAAPPLDEVDAAARRGAARSAGAGAPRSRRARASRAGRSGSPRRRWSSRRSGPPRRPREAVNRHSLLARVAEIVRVDQHGALLARPRRPSSGACRPRAITALPKLRRVRVDSSRRTWLREIGDPRPSARDAFLALNVASPLGEALDPLRLDPPLGWGRILPGAALPGARPRRSPGAAVELGVDARATRWPTRSSASPRCRIRRAALPATRRGGRLRAPLPRAPRVARRALRRRVPTARGAARPAQPAGAGARAGGDAHRGRAHAPALVWPRDVAARRRSRPGVRARASTAARRAARRRPARRAWRRRSAIADFARRPPVTRPARAMMKGHVDVRQ